MKCALTIFITVLSVLCYAGIENFYSFNSTTESYSYITGTVISGLNADEALSSAIDIGFSFPYGTQNFTQLKVSSNGWVGLGTSFSNTLYVNQISSTTNLPILAPLWDDLSVSSGNVSYLLSGSSPNRCFTIQYQNFKWRYNASNAFNMQVKLFENGKIKFLYGPRSGTPLSGSASIGINITPGGYGWYYSVTPGSPGSASRYVENSSVSVFPTANRVYEFNPNLSDLAALTTVGDLYPTVANPAVYTVSVANLGSTTQSNYQVSLVTDTGLELASVAGPAIQSGATLEVPLSWTPASAGPMIIRGKVQMTGDANPGNDLGTPLNINVFPQDTSSVTIGSGVQSGEMPMAMGYSNSLFECMYYPVELGFTSSVIRGIKFYNNFETNMPGKATKIWLGTTNQTAFEAGGWIPSTQLTLVYDGVVDYPLGTNEISIILNTPFSYAGGNLVMMVNRPWDTASNNSLNKFFCQTPVYEAERSLLLGSSFTVYDPASPPTFGSIIPSGQFPKTTFVFSDAVLTQFFRVPTSLTPVNNLDGNSAAAWGDYDNDGDMDILLTGDSSGGVVISKVFRNDGNSQFIDIAAGLTGVTQGSVAWGDYDNDGDLDILLSGESLSDPSYCIAKVYRNEGNGNFTDVAAGLTAVAYSSVAWGDCDNDGDLDILLTGQNITYAGTTPPVSKVYRNDGNSLFTDVNAGLEGVRFSSVDWGDYDCDGDLDILLTGEHQTSSQPISWMPIARIYRNDGSGSFTDANAGLPGVKNSSSVWGDYDGDGDLDILLTGFLNGFSTQISAVYRNDGNNSFININAGLTGVYDGSATWSDYDNDGDIDILLNGRTNLIQGEMYSLSSLTKLYHNLGNNSFEEIDTILPVSASGVFAWGDYDNDGDLDLLQAGGTESDGGWTAFIYRNNTSSPNQSPSAPQNLMTVRSGNGLFLQWDGATDDHTSQNGLSYSLRIGTTPGGQEVSSPMADNSGLRRRPMSGQIKSNAGWKVNISPISANTQYYFSVQAVDGAWSGSPFAPEISRQALQLLSPNGGEYLRRTTTQTIRWSSVTSLTHVNIQLSVNNGTSWIPLNSTPIEAGSGSYSFTVPSVSSTQCLIKIVSNSDPTFFDLSDAVFTIGNNPVSSITLTSPNASKLQIGKSYSIAWTSQGVSNLRLDYSLDGGLSWQLIAENVEAGAGLYSWLIPDCAATDQVFLKASDASNASVNDLNDAPCSIVKLQLTSPNGAEVWSANSAYNISWLAENISDLRLEYSLDGGGVWITVAENIAAAAGSVSWTTPDAQSTQCLVRVTDMDDAEVNDASDSLFEIQTPLRVIAPNGAEILNVFYIYDIIWQAAATVQTVLLDYSTDNGATWQPVQSTPYDASAGIYSWFVPSTLSEFCRIRIKDSADSSVFDVSDNVFTITDQLFPPTAAFSASVNSGLVPLTVQFTDTSLPGTGFLELWHWDFGDGTVSTLQNPQHTYNQAGNYSVTLMVTNSEALSDTLVWVDCVAAISISDPPAAPSGLQIARDGSNVLISWAEVTQTESGAPLVPDLYMVYYSVTGEAMDYTFLGSTSGLTYTHEAALAGLDRVFYRVTAFKQIRSRN